MPYSAELVKRLLTEHADAARALDGLILAFIRQGSILNGPTKEYLDHGVGRRLRVMRRCLTNVFESFPPATVRPLARETLDHVQISLQAFVMNLYGLFDNLAWAFVLRHGIEKSIDRRSIGMFLGRTQRYLPPELTKYLSQQVIIDWHGQYLKNYRDALAHRIPLYIPPAQFTNEDQTRHNDLDRSILDAIQAMNWELVERLQSEQDSLGTACMMFVHSYIDGEAPVRIHPQMVSDTKAAIEFCNLYLAHWHSVSTPPP